MPDDISARKQGVGLGRIFFSVGNNYLNNHQSKPLLSLSLVQQTELWVVPVQYTLAMDIIKTIHGVFKEVIIIYLYLLVISTPYYDPSNPPWNVVVNSMSSCR